MSNVSYFTSVKTTAHLMVKNTSDVLKTSCLKMGADMIDRFKRLALTFISKKYVAWVVAIALLWYGKIDGSEWCFLTAAIFTIDYYSKKELIVTKGAE